ncbi:MAG TPA: YciI family protein [Stellaceae bacterium]
MKYMILIHMDEQAFAGLSQAQIGERFGAYMAYTKALREAGVMVDGARLQPVKTGATVRVRDGRRQVQDGPVAETKEQLGGYYVIDVPSTEAALDWAARCPGASFGAVELRPLAPT